MDLNEILIWTVAASCGLSALELLRRGSAAWPGIMLPLGVAALLGASLWVNRAAAGYISGLAWFLLLFLPAGGSLFVDALRARRHFRLARWLATILSWIAPLGRTRHLPRLLRALEHLHRGNSHEGLALLDALREEPGEVGRLALLIRTRETSDWQGLLNWIADHPSRRDLVSDPLILDGYLQALGETGQRQRLLKEYDRLFIASQTKLPHSLLNIIRAKIAAFTGDDFIVAQLFGSVLGNTPPEIKRYWMATALQTSGRTDEALRDLQGLVELKSSPVSSAALRRLTSPLPAVSDIPLTPDEQQVLMHIAAAAEREMHHAGIHFERDSRTWVSWLLAAILLLVFLLELPGGSESEENLVRMGAMVVPVHLVEHGWWRVWTAPFLHRGLLHFFLNTLSLVILGRWLERSWGHWRMLATYLLAAVGSITVLAIIMTLRNSQPTIIVGASGGVMGLVGGLLVHSGCGMFSTPGRAASQDFLLLSFLVCFDIAFDLRTPEVSLTGHLAGLAIGVVCGACWNLAGILLARYPITRGTVGDASRARSS